MLFSAVKLQKQTKSLKAFIEYLHICMLSATLCAKVLNKHLVRSTKGG